MADFTSVELLTKCSNYRQSDFRIDTGFRQSENAVQFLMAQDGSNDLFLIKKARTGTQSTEVHVYSSESSYQTLTSKTVATALHETDHSWTFALGANRDLFAIRKSDNSNDHSQLHVLSNGSDYGNFERQQNILPGDHKLGHDYEFLLDSKDDLWVIKKQRTPSSMTEIHVLSAAGGYAPSVQYVTGLPWTDLTWSFLGVDPNEDVWVVNKKERRLCRLTKKSLYKEKDEVKLDSRKLESRFDHRCSFALATNRTEDPATFDLCVFKTSRTSSGNVTLRVVEKPFHHQSPLMAEIREESPTGFLTTGDENAFSWITRSTIPVPAGKSGDGLNESYLRIVKKIPTRTPNEPKFVTQVSFLRESYRFQLESPRDTMVTAWPASGGNTCEFLFAKNMDMYVVKKSNCRSKKVEVHLLSWVSNYLSSSLVGPTPLDQVFDHTWTFLLANNLDLICIHKSGTESAKTECWRLLHDDGVKGRPYSKWAPQTDYVTALGETDDAWEFLLAPDDDLYAIQKYGTGSPGLTEIKVPSAQSEWKTITKEFKTALPQTDYNYSFCLTTDLNLVAVQKSRFPFSADMASI